jgi:ATP-dependent Clp protease ATP-binding subunit ClpA
MYGLGLSTKAIQENLKDIYNVYVSPELISRITEEVKGLVNRFEAFYPVIFFDALRVHSCRQIQANSIKDEAERFLVYMTCSKLVEKLALDKLFKSVKGNLYKFGAA